MHDNTVLLISTLSACGSAIFAGYSAYKSHKSMQGNAIIKITESESRARMRDALDHLSQFKNEELRKEIPDSMDSDRRIITQHFLTLYRLRKQSVISQKTFGELLDVGQVELLLGPVRTIHEIKAKEKDLKINEEMYDEYQKWWNKKR